MGAHAEQLEHALQQAANQGGSDAVTLAALVLNARRLREQLAAAAVGARATGEQIKAEAERPKRTSLQAELGAAAAAGNPEPKRCRNDKQDRPQRPAERRAAKPTLIVFAAADQHRREHQDGKADPPGVKDVARDLGPAECGAIREDRSGKCQEMRGSQDRGAHPRCPR